MYNTRLKTDLKDIKPDTYKLIAIEKTNVGGSSITLINQASSEDLACYTYYDRVEQRDADFNELEKFLAQ